MKGFWDALFVDEGAWSHHLSVPDGSGWRQIPWHDVVREAESYAHGLRSRGVGAGDVVGTVLTNSPEAVSGLLGIWLAGGVAASMPVPARGMDLPEYTAQLLAMTNDFHDALILTDDAIAAILDGAAGGAGLVRGWSEVRGAGRLADAPPTGEELAFLQYSSGSTSAPKGCMLSADAIAAQIAMIIEMLDATPCDEIAVSWLPLSHDMGLFGVVLPACAYGGDLFLSSPERFLRSPGSWFDDCMETGARMTAGPDSALRLAARAAGTTRGAAPLRLDHLIVGAEPIHTATLEAATTAYADAGLTADVFIPAYGMAEATLAVTAIGRDEGPTAIAVAGEALAAGIVEVSEDEGPDSVSIVSVGRALGDVEVTLADGPPDALAEIQVRSPSLADGYFGDAERTARHFADGAFMSGDLGFLHDGELYVVGRLDDMISVNGKNVYATEVESAMTSLGAIRKGCCTIVDVRQREGAALVALAEVADDSTDLRRLAAEMSQVATRVAGVRLDECLFLPKGGLPKTPSGKVQRYRSRRLAMQVEVGEGSRVALT
jgi:fatty-acyl-CoA synthase